MREDEAAKYIIRLARRELDEQEVAYFHFGLLKHITIERFHPFLIEAGVPLTTASLEKIAPALHTWVLSWYEESAKGKWGPSHISKRIQQAKKILLPLLGKQMTTPLFKWSKNCWAVGPTFPGDDIWDSMLYHLVYFTKTYTRLPRELYRNRPLRNRIEDLYLDYEKEKESFEKRLKRHIKSFGPMSDWEKLLAHKCGWKAQLKTGFDIKYAHEHLAFCKFWKAFNEAITPPEFAILKEWMIREAEFSCYDPEHLDLVNCKCLPLSPSDLL